MAALLIGCLIKRLLLLSVDLLNDVFDERRLGLMMAWLNADLRILG